MVEAQQLLQEYGGRITTLDLHTAHFALTAYNGGKFKQAIDLARQTLPLARQVGGLYSKGIAERIWRKSLIALGPENYQELKIT